MKAPLLLLAVVVATGAARADDETMQMANAVQGFYQAYETFKPPDGIPTADVRKRFEPFISKALDNLLTDAANAEDREQKTAKTPLPPLISGDPFTPNFDGATSYSVGVCTADPRGARCRVALSFQGDKPRDWTDTAWLVKTDDGWRVNDIEFDAKMEQGASDRLSGTLRSVIDHAGALKQ